MYEKTEDLWLPLIGDGQIEFRCAACRRYFGRGLFPPGSFLLHKCGKCDRINRLGAHGASLASLGVIKK
ncbi:MAG: hypothetical protein ABSA71_15385 [Desulfomonilia bacterium]|jgi:phage FluMu protein Com